MPSSVIGRRNSGSITLASAGADRGTRAQFGRSDITAESRRVCGRFARGRRGLRSGRRARQRVPSPAARAAGAPAACGASSGRWRRTGSAGRAGASGVGEPARARGAGAAACRCRERRGVQSLEAGQRGLHRGGRAGAGCRRPRQLCCPGSARPPMPRRHGALREVNRRRAARALRLASRLRARSAAEVRTASGWRRRCDPKFTNGIIAQRVVGGQAEHVHRQPGPRPSVVAPGGRRRSAGSAR